MTTYSEFKLAAIQAAPVFFDRESSTKKACRLIQEAGVQGATIAAFSETWLPGYVLMSQGTQIHIAAWPGSERKAPPSPAAMWPRQLLLSRAFASQAAAYVILVGGLLSAEHIPEAYQEFESAYTGDSCIIDPRGEVIAGPAEGEAILIADASMEHILAAKSACDVAGHYSRPDIFQLHVNQTPYHRVVETPGPEYIATEPDSEQNS